MSISMHSFFYAYLFCLCTRGGGQLGQISYLVCRCNSLKMYKKLKFEILSVRATRGMKTIAGSLGDTNYVKIALVHYENVCIFNICQGRHISFLLIYVWMVISLNLLRAHVKSSLLPKTRKSISCLYHEPEATISSPI